MRGRRVPLHRASEARIDVGFAFSDPAELQRAAGSDALVHALGVEERLGLGIAVRLRGDGDHPAVRPRPDRDHRLAQRIAMPCADARRAPPGFAQRGRGNDPEDGLSVLDQADIDGELATAADELARAVQGSTSQNDRPATSGMRPAAAASSATMGMPG